MVVVNKSRDTEWILDFHNIQQWDADLETSRPDYMEADKSLKNEDEEDVPRDGKQCHA